MARNGQKFELGTESVGTTVWPGQGSSNWARSGYGSAAYQRNVCYLNTSGQSVWSTLTRYQPSPACYSISGPFYSTNSAWGIYFYDGGPGGTKCQ